jgi:hypothetical protein
VDGARIVASGEYPKPVPFFLSAEAVREFQFVLGDLTARLANQFHVGHPDLKLRNAGRPTELRSVGFDGAERSGLVVSCLNEATFSIDLTSQTVGVLLRKTYDRFHGRQRARVLLNNAPRGIWYEPEGNRSERWGVSTFAFPLCETTARSSSPGEGTMLTIDPLASSPLWSMGLLEVFLLER